MKGKAGIVVGLAVGYVLGSRAGRERYDQIKTQWLKVWNTPPVQKQLDNAKELAKTAALALPSTVWDGAVKVVKAATSSKGTPGQKLDAAIKTADESADDVSAAAKKAAAAAKKSGAAVKDAAADAVDGVQKAAHDADGA